MIARPSFSKDIFELLVEVDPRVDNSPIFKTIANQIFPTMISVVGGRRIADLNGWIMTSRFLTSTASLKGFLGKDNAHLKNDVQA